MAGAKGVKHLLAYLIDGDAIDRRLLAVDLHPHLWILDVEIHVDIAYALDLGDALPHLGTEPIERFRVARLQRVLELGLRDAAVELGDVLLGREDD